MYGKQTEQNAVMEWDEMRILERVNLGLNVKGRDAESNSEIKSTQRKRST